MTLKHLISPEERRKKLKAVLESKKIIRGIEVHNAISALIANDLQIEVEKDGLKKINEFDFFWESSFTDSASKGYPDIEIISFDSRLKTIAEILDITDKPMIVDGDTGGNIHHFEYLIPKLEKIGVSAVIIEDKIFPKRNSLDSSANQEQEEPDSFADKIKAGKKMQQSADFMIIARIESLIAGKDVSDAIIRAKKYLLAGVDGIMIHSNKPSSKEILDFAKEYETLGKEIGIKKPLVCVPTTYNAITEKELENHGFNIVIYANHMLRASYKAMQNIGRIILENERSLEADPYISSVKEIFEKVGFNDITEKDKLISNIPSVIIPAAGEENLEFRQVIGDIPRALINLHGKSLLEHQIQVFKKLGLNDINVVIGWNKEKFNISGVNYFYNPDYSTSGMIHSLMKAKEKMRKGFVYVNSDILFDERLVRELLSRKDDIAIVVDSSYLYHKHEVDKMLDCVITKYGKHCYQKLRKIDDELLSIGTKIPKELITHEFIGMAKFSKAGAESLIKVYEDCKENSKGEFHEVKGFDFAYDTDMFQELVDRGFKINILETNGGWLEIHNRKDIEFAKDILGNSS